MRRRITAVVEHEEIEERENEDHNRSGNAKEHEGDDVRLPAKTGALQIFAQFLVVETLAKLELIDDPLHEALRRRPQPSALRTLLRSHLGKPDRPHFAALDRHLFHPPVHLVTLQHRQRDRQNSRKYADRRQHRRDELRVHYRFDEYRHSFAVAIVCLA